MEHQHKMTKSVLQVHNSNLSQLNHAFLQKWAVLEDCSVPSSEGNVGFLQLDISIVTSLQKSTPVIFPSTDCDTIEDNLLLPLADSKNLQRVKYSISILQGEFDTKANYAIQVSFGGIKSRTKLAHNSNVHEWNEKIAFIGTFPSLTQTFIFEIIVSDCCYKRILTSKELPFSKLSKQIDSVYSLPTFGPSYLYFYHGHHNEAYVGRLLLTISTEVIHNRSVSPRKCQSFPITVPLDTTAFWTEENFLMKLIILNVLVFDTSKPAKITVALKCLSQSSNAIELKLDKHPTSKVRYANFQEFPSHQRPMLTVGFRCADFRWKYLLTIALHRAFTYGQELLRKYVLFRMDNVDAKIETMKRVMQNVLDEFHKVLKEARTNFYVGTDKRLTHWDHKRMLYVVEQVDLLSLSINQLKLSLSNATLDDMSTFQPELSRLVHTLEDLVYDEQSTFPECLLSVHHSIGRGCCKQRKGKRCTHFDAISRLNTIEYLYFPSVTTDGDGDRIGSPCAKRSTILPRPSRCQHSCDPEWCGCVYAKLDVAIWAGTEQEANEWEKRRGVERERNVLSGKENQQPRERVQCGEAALAVQCIVNVHQGKIQPGFDSTGLSDPKLVVLVENYEMVTSVVPQTLSPLWNEVVEFSNIKLLNNDDWFRSDELTVMLLLLDEDKRMCSQKKDEIIGIGWVKCRLRSAAAIDRDPRADAKDTSPPESTNADTSSLRNQSLLDNDRQGESVTIAAQASDKPSDSVGHHPQEVDNKITVSWKRNKHAPAGDLWNEFDDRRDSVLRWVGCYRNGQRMADILMSIRFENVNENDDEKVTMRLIHGIPASICPKTQKFYVEVLFAGLRNLHSLTRSSAGRFRVQVIFGELKLMSGLSYRNTGQSLGFSDIYDTGTLMLPSRFEYWPPMVIQHIEYSQLKKDRIVGANIIDRPELSFKEDTLEPIKHYLIKTYRSHNDNERISIDTFFSAEDQPLIESSKRKSTLTQKLLPALIAVKTVVDRKIKAATGRNRGSKISAATRRRGSLETEYTWWTKFYNSCSSQPSDYKHKLKIFSCELEAVPEFECFHDWSAPVPLLKKVDHSMKKPPKVYGHLKCKITIRSADDQSNENGSTSPVFNQLLRSIPNLITETNVTVVVYIVQGLNLRSRDIFSLSDAYVKLEYGNEKIVDRPNFVKDQANPIFGRRFVMHGRLPRDQALKVSVIDRDTCSSDDLIGSTIIDIEDRFRTRHFATFGLPQEFNTTGYNAWRFPKKPSSLLDQICFQNGIVGPTYFGSVVQLAGVTFHDETVLSTIEDIRERLALTVLKNFHKIPVIGCHLVPEHVESRSLFHSDHPGIEQGKLQLWTEVYHEDSIPTLVDITPNPPKPYELRIIVWNTQDVILDERNIFGTEMSDIYVKCWIQNVEDAQFTDIHYRSLDGTGNFNWRMIFPFVYSSSETMMVVTRKKSFYEQLDTEQKVPPLLTVQVWDNDIFSRDDFLGTLNLNLAQLLRPATKPGKCSLQPPDATATARDQYLNLFREEKVRGWYPIVGKVNNKIAQTGKIELELQIMTEEEALLRPAGRGRKPPQKLANPDRPDTSFNWYRNPLKSFRMILWPFARKVCLFVLVIALGVLLCYGLISNTPKTIIAKAIARKASLDHFVSTGVMEE
ncbi:fer-1-like protein 6 [Ochlerotatus camptorhynchus]|uniref:fer-1-like protein 6 n=1 Tax=Ochlerotatus camptorhynchus TaxID=644619 RepID=UPI0031D85468